MIRMASTRLGMATIRSMMREITLSSQPPAKAATRPSPTPHTIDTAMTLRPMKSE